MLKRFFDLLIKVVDSRTLRFKSPDEVQVSEHNLLDAPFTDTQYTEGVLSPVGWEIDAEDQMEALREARDLMFIGLDHRSSMLKSIIVPTVYPEEYMLNKTDVLLYKYPYCK